MKTPTQTEKKLPNYNLFLPDKPFQFFVFLSKNMHIRISATSPNSELEFTSTVRLLDLLTNDHLNRTENKVNSDMSNDTPTLKITSQTTP